MPEIIQPRDHDHWLELRAPDITSTETPALFGLSPYCTKFELFHRKQGNAVVDFQENERMKWGNRLEAAIAQGAAEELGLTVQPLKCYMRHSDEPRMGSSFDFEVIGEPVKILMEVKNVDGLVWRDQWWDSSTKTATPPPHIEIQCQTQLEVSDYAYLILVVLVGGNDLHIIHIDRNRKVGKGLRIATRKFWASVDANEPPEPDFVRDAAFISALYQDGSGETLDARQDDILTALAVEYAAAAERAKAHDDAKKAAKAKILAHIGDAGKVIGEGYTISAGNTKETPPTVITEEMIGQTFGGRKSYRAFRVNLKKEG
jgi:putative phage-type endonuclease